MSASANMNASMSVGMNVSMSVGMGGSSDMTGNANMASPESTWVSSASWAHHIHRHMLILKTGYTNEPYAASHAICHIS